MDAEEQFNITRKKITAQKIAIKAKSARTNKEGRKAKAEEERAKAEEERAKAEEKKAAQALQDSTTWKTEAKKAFTDKVVTVDANIDFAKETQKLKAEVVY